MVDINSAVIVDFVAAQPRLFVLVALAIGACALIGLGVATNRRRVRAIAAALGDSTRSSLRWQRPPDAAGFSAYFSPAPEPFGELRIDFSAANRFSPLDLMKRLVHNRTQELRFTGRLVSAPLNEILWTKHHLPARALGRSQATDLWVEKRLDFIRGFYALHGVNTNAIDHAFGEMQGRFGAFVQSINVINNSPSQVVVVLSMSGFNSEEIPALVAALRSLARAALIA